MDQKNADKKPDRTPPEMIEDSGLPAAEMAAILLRKKNPKPAVGSDFSARCLSG